MGGRSVAVTVLAITVLAITSCGNVSAGNSRYSPTVVELGVTEDNFSIVVSAPSVPAGRVDVNIKNLGPSPHELLIVRTNLPADVLPLGNDGRVNEGAVAVVVNTHGSLLAGASRQIAVTLRPGRYVLICNLAGHYQAGMHTVLTVG